MSYNICNFKNGIKDGIPVALGYLAVSFSFGIVAKTSGLTIFQAVLMSATNVTSAGQFAGLGLISASASYMELAIIQLIINLRYSLMSCAISQKIDFKVPFFHRFFIGFGITDEIFGLSVCKKEKLNPFYNYGLMSVAIPGWILGTLFGVISGNILPERIINALSIAIYGMFIAIIIPPAKENKMLTGVIMISMISSFMFTKLPVLNQISSGFKLIILSVFISGIAAFFSQSKEVVNEK